MKKARRIVNQNSAAPKRMTTRRVHKTMDAILTQLDALAVRQSHSQAKASELALFAILEASKQGILNLTGAPGIIMQSAIREACEARGDFGDGETEDFRCISRRLCDAITKGFVAEPGPFYVHRSPLAGLPSFGHRPANPPYRSRKGHAEALRCQRDEAIKSMIEAAEYGDLEAQKTIAEWRREVGERAEAILKEYGKLGPASRKLPDGTPIETPTADQLQQWFDLDVKPVSERQRQALAYYHDAAAALDILYEKVLENSDTALASLADLSDKLLTQAGNSSTPSPSSEQPSG